MSTHPWPSRKPHSGEIAAVDGRIGHLDKISFLGLRACGYKEIIQFTWIYCRPIDFDAVHRFHQNLGYGLLGRVIERSPLPVARERWVLSRAPQGLDIAPTARPRSGVSGWADERAGLALDPERGPSWHLGVLPLTDGGAAISLAASHTVADAVGMSLTVAEAADDRRRELGYPPPRSRSWAEALRDDGRNIAAAVPAMARALPATWQLVRRKRQLGSAAADASPSPRTPLGDQPATITTVTAYVDLTQWDNRVESLRGTSNSLFAGVAARLGARVGRVADDGSVTLFCPVNERTDGDTRGNALNYAVVRVDPTHAARDLTDTRSRIKQSLVELAANSNDSLALLPLASAIPPWMARRMTGLWQGSGNTTIGCSNVGDLHPAVNRPDGTDADYLSVRLTWQGSSNAIMDQLGGKLFLLSGRVHDKLFVAITACPVGHDISKSDLAAAVSRTFEEFALTPEIE